jgi:hypothetical protein
MRRALVGPLVAVFVMAMSVGALAMPLASFGNQLAQCTPQFAANGRAVAFDPATGHLFWTNDDFDTNIYVVGPAPNCTQIDILATNPPTVVGALSWDKNRHELWGGAYDGTGRILEISPDFLTHTAVVTPAFVALATVAGPACFGGAGGFIDGLGYDGTGFPADSLWISGDGAQTIQHYSTAGGAPISSTPVPASPGGCNSGIAVDTGTSLWLAMLPVGNPNAGPFSIVKVSKADTSTALASFTYTGPQQGGPEGVALDLVTFPGKCALWTNQFNLATLTAWDITGQSDSCPPAPPPPPQNGKATGGGDVPAGATTANFGFNARVVSGVASGNLEYNPKGGTALHCNVTLVTAFTTTGSTSSTGPKGGGSMDFTVSCNKNTSTHHVHVEDNNEPGAGADKFTIDGVGGNITHGNIQIHPAQ